MIAKATKPGKSFGGIIDYLYDGKVSERGRTEKNTKIIAHSDDLRIPRDADDLYRRDRLKSDFIRQAKSHHGYRSGAGEQKYVGQHILSFSSEDSQRITPDLLLKVVADYVRMAGLEKTQYMAVTHHDTDILHAHVLFNRVQNDGTKYKAWQEENRTVERGVALSLKYDLSIVGEMKAISRTKGVVDLRSKMDDIREMSQDTHLLGVRNMHHLQKKAELDGFELRKGEDFTFVAGKEYRTADLLAVFAHNRSQSGVQQENSISTSKMAAEATFSVSDSVPVFIHKNKAVREAGKAHKPRKKRVAAHKIKVAKLEQTKLKKSLNR